MGKTRLFFCDFFLRIVSILSSKGRTPRFGTLRAASAGAFRAHRQADGTRLRHGAFSGLMHHGSAVRNTPLRFAPLSQKWRFCASLFACSKNFAKSNFCKVLLISSKQSCFPARPAPPGQPLRGGRHCSPKNDTVLPEQLPTPTDNDRQRRAP